MKIGDFRSWRSRFLCLGGLLCLMLSNTSSDTEYFLVSVLLLLDLLSRSLSLLLKTNLLEGYIEIINNKSSDDGFYKT